MTTCMTTGTTARAWIAAALALAALAGCRRASPDGAPTEATAPAAPPPAAPASRRATAAAVEDDLVGEAPESNPTSETVTIKLVADPARKARVFWGRKDLGLAPLEVQRPRGSGPLDLYVVTPGALALHTRVYTDRDDKLALRLYAESEAPALLGYHAPVDAPPGLADAAKRKPAMGAGAGARKTPTHQP
jgi:hypothetical protein